MNERSLFGDDKQVVAWRDAGQGGDKTLAVDLHRLQLKTHPDHLNVSPPLCCAAYSAFAPSVVTVSLRGAGPVELDGCASLLGGELPRRDRPRRRRRRRVTHRRRHALLCHPICNPHARLRLLRAHTPVRCAVRRHVSSLVGRVGPMPWMGLRGSGSVGPLHAPARTRRALPPAPAACAAAAPAPTRRRPSRHREDHLCDTSPPRGEPPPEVAYITHITRAARLLSRQAATVSPQIMVEDRKCQQC